MTPRRKPSALLLVALIVVASGCGRKPTESPDAQVLEALAAYNAIPTLDGRGRVVELKLEGPQVDDRALEFVKQLPELKTLSLYGSSITDDGLANLKDARRLEALGLGKTKVTRRGLAHLERLPALQWLWITENKTLTPTQIEDFKKKAVPGITVYR
jgi:hypothetical protein